MYMWQRSPTGLILSPQVILRILFPRGIVSVCHFTVLCYNGELLRWRISERYLRSRRLWTPFVFKLEISCAVFGSRVQLWRRVGHSDGVMKVLVLMTDWCSLLVSWWLFAQFLQSQLPVISVLCVQDEVWLLSGVFCSLSEIPRGCVISGFLCWWKISYFIAVSIWFASIFLYNNTPQWKYWLWRQSYRGK